MSKKISPTLIGAFVIGALALFVIADGRLFGSGQLFARPKNSCSTSTARSTASTSARR